MGWTLTNMDKRNLAKFLTAPFIVIYNSPNSIFIYSPSTCFSLRKKNVQHRGVQESNLRCQWTWFVDKSEDFRVLLTETCALRVASILAWRKCSVNYLSSVYYVLDTDHLGAIYIHSSVSVSTPSCLGLQWIWKTGQEMRIHLATMHAHTHTHIHMLIHT